MTYKILEVNAAEGWVKLELTFDDGEVRIKRMMADVSSLASIEAAVAAWYADYAPTRVKKDQVEAAVNDAILKGTVTTVKP